MKMFRLALAGALSALVLLSLQPLALATCVIPPLGMLGWDPGDDMVNHHFWQSLGTLYNDATYPTVKVAAPSESRQLAVEDRVTYQRAIEEVYWRHRIWPNERSDPKPPLDAVMSKAAIEQKVEDYLRNSELLEQEWQKPITSEQLQAEMDRMAEHTKQPEVLRELFAALGNDPFVIAECLARPVLVGRLQFATVEWGKKPLESWSGRAQDQIPKVMVTATANYTLPAILDQPSGCIDDSWTATSTTNAPTAREYHTAVWTGNEMIVWGGSGPSFGPTGGRYNPSTDTWTATSTTNAPTARGSHTAVWTGSEMIVWGGVDGQLRRLNTGGRYNPGTNSWTATSTTNVPEVRASHTAVWTGSEMIVWGGEGGGFSQFNTGGRYNPSTDTWMATSTTNAPTGRVDHTAVWTGSEMIVWGGYGNGNFLNTGGRYNPGTNTWAATNVTNAPSARILQSEVWTGSEMIVWGGTLDGTFPRVLNTGGRYIPGTDSWTATSNTNVPDAREYHTAVWTGSQMIVWGGQGFDASYLTTGGRYDPSTDSWIATNTTNVPDSGINHTAIWSGSEMIVWGGFNDNPGYLNTGGRYCAQAGGLITLSAAKRKVEGINTVRLRWNGATSNDIDVYRNSTLIRTVQNAGTYIDSTGDTGRAMYVYKVCDAGTSTCSNGARVRFQQ